jgi:hypothetical protein
MDAAVEKVEAQLTRWDAAINKLAAKNLTAGARARFEDLTYVDELKALHAIALSKLTEFKASKDGRRARLKAEMKNACNELEAALQNPRPSP